MIRLFNSVFLDHLGNYSSKYDCDYAVEKPQDHPITRPEKKNELQYSLAGFEKVIEEEYEGNLDSYWRSLFEIKSKGPFVIYCDHECLIQLLCSFWKSIFEDPDKEHTFSLYNIYRKEAAALKYLDQDGKSVQFLPKLSFEEFSYAFDKAEQVKALETVNKEILSFEYLLGNYFADPNSYYNAFFWNKIRVLSWESWFSDLEELKSQVLKNLYNVKKLFPEYENFDLVHNEPEEILEFHSHLRWITDRDFSVNNINYVMKTYPKHIFPELQNRCDKVFLVAYLSDKIDIDEVEVCNRASRTEHLFNEDYIKILEEDIALGHGCHFFPEGECRFFGSYLSQFLYGLKSDQKRYELEKFRLK